MLTGWCSGEHDMAVFALSTKVFDLLLVAATHLSALSLFMQGLPPLPHLSR